MLGDICLFCRHVRTPNLLLCDGHEPHIGESIIAEFSGHQSDRLIIPGGCTSKLQPLDVSLKSMFHVSDVCLSATRVLWFLVCGSINLKVS